MIEWLRNARSASGGKPMAGRKGKIIIGDNDITGDVKDLEIEAKEYVSEAIAGEMAKKLRQPDLKNKFDIYGSVNTPINLTFDQYYDPNSYSYKFKQSITDPWGTNPEPLPEVEEVEVEQDVTIYLVVEDGQAIPMSAEYLAQYLARRSSLDGVTVQEWTKVEDGKFELQ